MPATDEQLVDAIARITPALLNAMNAFEQAGPHFHPTRIEQIAGAIKPFGEALAEAHEAIAPLEFPEHIARFGQHLNDAATYALRACDALANAGTDTFAAMRAMRAQCRAQEKLYPVAGALRPVSEYYLEPAARDNAALVESLNEGGPNLGLLTTNNDRKVRGGYCLYVPENIDREKPTSLVVALHGGTGHGADFIWSWLREARTRGFLLLAPTSQLDTWSLMDADHDLPYLHATIDVISGQFKLDREHVLLTGMSDGGTYAMLAGIREDSPFTHIAPFSGVLHPEISMSGRIRKAQDKRIYLVHGTEDWMFPIETAYMAQAELEAGGADLTFRPIDGLSHTYCRTENPAVLEWFNSALSIPKGIP